MTESIIDFADAQLKTKDHIVRGTAANGMVRAFAITAKDTVETARANHHASPVVTAALGRLMMAAQMMGVMFKGPEELVSLIVSGDGPIEGLTVTANTHGQVKGFANHLNVVLPPNAQGKLDVGGGIGQGTLTVVRDQPGCEPYTSQVELITGEIAEDLTYYFTVSDQVPSSVGLGVLVNRDASVRQAGGFIVQLMPGFEEEVLDKLEENLNKVASVTNMIEAGMSPSDMLEQILEDLDYNELEVLPAQFFCGCNKERAQRAAMALGADELRDMIEKNEPFEAYCHFCGRRHYLKPEELKQILENTQS